MCSLIENILSMSNDCEDIDVVINDNSFSIYDEWFASVNNNNNNNDISLLNEKVINLMLQYCRPKEMIVMILEKMMLINKNELFFKILLLIEKVFDKLKQKALFLNEIISSSLQSLKRLIMVIVIDKNNDNDNDDDFKNLNIQKLINLYIDWINRLLVDNSFINENNSKNLLLSLLEVCCDLITLNSNELQRRGLTANVIKTLYNIQELSIMEEILFLHSDSYVSTEGSHLLAYEILPDYVIDRDEGSLGLLPKVYSKKYMWNIFSSHILGGVSINAGGIRFITSLRGILYCFNDRSRKTVTKMKYILSECMIPMMGKQYDIDDIDSNLIVTIVNTVMSCSDQDVRNDTLIIIRFILCMYHEHALISLIQKLVIDFELIPSVAALFLDFLKDYLQHMNVMPNDINDDNYSNNLQIDIRKHEPFSFRFVYQYFILNVLKNITSNADSDNWLLDHYDTVSATFTLFHSIALRIVKDKEIISIKECVEMIYHTRHAMNKTLQKNNNLQIQLLSFELEHVEEIFKQLFK